MNICILMIGLLFGGFKPAQAAGRPPLADAEPAGDTQYQDEIEQQFKMLTAAYDLDTNAQALLWEELQRRANDQPAYDQATEVQLANLAARISAANALPGSPEDQAFSAELDNIVNRMPLAPYEVALWTEGQVPVEVVAEGRVRYQELRQRKDQRQSVMQLEDPIRQGGLKRELLEARQADTAPVTPSAKPMPVGPKGARVKAEIAAKADVGQVVEPNQGLAGATPVAKPEAAPAAPAPPQPSEFVIKPGKAGKPAERKPPPAKTPGESKVDARPKPPPGATAPQPPPQQPPPGAAAPPPQPPPPKAPPLDEWEKYVIQTSEKYGFTESQITQARGILREMRQRALQYSLSRAADFEHADELPDAKVRQERLGQLNKPLNALFDELKRRVEALPTTEQRQHVGAAPGGKGQSPTKASPQPGKPTVPPKDQPKGKPVPPPKN